MNQLLKLSLIFFGLLVVSVPVSAVIETYEFKDDELRQRYHRFTDELRCPKCQNQNLTGSNSPISKDLRRELHRLLEEGKDDRQIVDYMVSRYGDFILYRPQLNKQTAVLWAAPAVFAALGVIALVLIFMKQRKKTLLQNNEQGISSNADELDANEQQALNELLGGTNDRSNDAAQTEVNNRG